MAKVKFTDPRVDAFNCPPDKAQAFCWDSTTPGLGLRVTPAGKPAFVFQGEYQGRSLRVTEFLKAQGFARVSNVAGGIEAWAERVDPSLQRY